jgi:capsular polysaccharide biosynthesis protein
VIIPLFAVIAAAYVCWNVLPKTYTAETTLYVLTRSDTESLSYNELTVSTQLVNDYQELAESRRVLSGAAEMLGLDFEQMKNEFDINVDSTTSTRLITLQVTGESAAQVANLANAMATQLSECITDVTNVENINVVDQAIPPIEPSGPKSLQIIAVAGAAGLFLSAMFAIILEMVNAKILTREDVQEYLGVSVLAQIPLDNN